MRKSLSLLLCALMATTFSLQAEARGGSGSGSGSGGSHGNSSSSSQGNSGNRGSDSGPSDNSQAADNTNGKFAQDKKTGLDRAQDRMSEAGLEHQKATEAHDQQSNDSTDDSQTTTQ